MNKRIFLVLISVALLFSVSCGDRIAATQTAEAAKTATEQHGTALAALQQATVDTAIRQTADYAKASGIGNGEPASETPAPAANNDSANTSSGEAPMISVSQNTFCRTGPGGVYDLYGTLLVGQNAEITAWDGKGDYYYIVNPDNSRSCWVWGEYGTVAGDTSGLPVFTPPPTPTPSFTPTNTLTPSITPTPSFTPSVTPSITPTNTETPTETPLGPT